MTERPPTLLELLTTAQRWYDDLVVAFFMTCIFCIILLTLYETEPSDQVRCQMQ